MLHFKWSKLINVGVLLCSVLFVCVITEIVLSIFLPQNTKIIYLRKGAEDNYDPVVGWTHYKNSSFRIKSTEFDNVVNINNEGFADDEFQLSKGDKEVRIVALGDSFTMGKEVKKNERHSDILERLLNSDSTIAGGYSFNILNFGMDGYSTCNEYLTLVHKAMKYKPDIVLLFFYIGNDISDKIYPVSNSPKCRFDNSGTLIKTVPPVNKEDEQSLNAKIADLITGTNIGVLFFNKLRFSPLIYRVKSLFGKQSNFSTLSLFDKDSTIKNTGLANIAVSDVVGMKEYLECRNIPFWVVITPDRMQVQKEIWKSIVNKYGIDSNNYDLEMPNNLISARFRERGIDCIDLLPVFRDVVNDVGNLYYYHDNHFNRTGHRVTAEAVYSALKARYKRIGMNITRH